MDLVRLVRSLLAFDALSARQWVADAVREGLRWSDVPEPHLLDPTERAVAAGIAELLAQRSAQEPPRWTLSVPPSPAPLYLLRSAQTMTRLRRLCQEEGPEPLRSRRIYAPPEFLSVA